MSNNSSKKTQIDFVTRQCSTIRCKSYWHFNGKSHHTLCILARLCSFRLLFISIDVAQSCWPALQYVWRNKKMVRWMDCFKGHFFITEFTYCQKDYS